MEDVFPFTQEALAASWELLGDAYEQLAQTKSVTCPGCHTHDFRCEDGCYWLALAEECI